jgi:hypothetical protein
VVETIVEFTTKEIKVPEYNRSRSETIEIVMG